MIVPNRATDTVILALDQGTSSSRALVVDESGAILATAQTAIGRTFPRPGWVEQDAVELWEAQRDAARLALAQSGVPIAHVAAVAITNQRETTVLWDRASGVPIAPAIVWQDRRTAARCQELRGAGHEDLIRRRTGLLLDPYFSATKIAWLLDSVPEARRRAEAGDLAFGTIDTWLAWQLSGGRLHITDATNASRTLLYDIHRGDWDDELLELFDVPRTLLPEIVDTAGILGYTSAEALGARLPLGAMIGDQQSSLFGQACTAPGMTKATYGTGCFVLMNTGTTAVASGNGLLTTVALQRGGRRDYALEGSVFMAGATIQWLRDGLHLIADAADSEPLAAGVPDTGGVYFVPAMAGLGAPHWDADARGAILGITSGTTAAHIARAALEGVAFQVADLCAALAADAGRQPPELRVDGGAAASNVLLQTQADLLGFCVARAAQPEATALGAAALGGLALGVWHDVAPMQSDWHAGRRFEPNAHVARAERFSSWRAAVASVRSFAGGRKETS